MTTSLVLRSARRPWNPMRLLDNLNIIWALVILFTNSPSLVVTIANGNLFLCSSADSGTINFLLGIRAEFGIRMAEPIAIDSKFPRCGRRGCYDRSHMVQVCSRFRRIPTQFQFRHNERYVFELCHRIFR